MTESIEDLCIHEPVLGLFSKARENKRLGHAYLFTGPSLIGKSQTAFAVAKMLCCQQPKSKASCGQCIACQQIEAGSYPDVSFIEAEQGDKIKIEQIRILLSRIGLRSFAGGMKVFIIKDVQQLTAQAANALLKTLEEPTSDTVLILTTPSLSNVMETIRSRCQIIPFHPISDKALEKQIQEIYKVEPACAHFIAYFSQGCLGKAGRLLEEDFFKKKNDLLNNFVFDDNIDDFVKQISKDKILTGELLDVLFSWIRDAMLLKVGVADQRIIHQDMKGALEDFTQSRSFEILKGLYEAIVQTRQMLNDNLNLRMSLLIIKERLRYG